MDFESLLNNNKVYMNCSYALKVWIKCSYTNVYSLQIEQKATKNVENI